MSSTMTHLDYLLHTTRRIPRPHTIAEAIDMSKERTAHHRDVITPHRGEIPSHIKLHGHIIRYQELIDLHLGETTTNPYFRGLEVPTFMERAHIKEKSEYLEFWKLMTSRTYIDALIPNQEMPFVIHNKAYLSVTTSFETLITYNEWNLRVVDIKPTSIESLEDPIDALEFDVKAKYWVPIKL